MLFAMYLVGRMACASSKREHRLAHPPRRERRSTDNYLRDEVVILNERGLSCASLNLVLSRHHDVAIEYA